MGTLKKRPIEPFRRATGEQFQHGTINVKVAEQVPFRVDICVPENEVPIMFGWKGDYLLQKCRVEGVEGYRINGGHGAFIIEVMSATWIKKDGKDLLEGDELVVEFFD